MYAIYYDDGNQSIHYENHTEERVALMMWQQCVEDGPEDYGYVGVELVKWTGEDGEEMETMMYHEFKEDDA